MDNHFIWFQNELETQMHFYMPMKVTPPEQKQEEIVKEETVRDVPKTDFAKREDYKSTVKHAKQENIKDIAQDVDEMQNEDSYKEIQAEIVDQPHNEEDIEA